MKTQQEVISFFKKRISEEKPAVLWRLPNDSSIKGLFANEVLLNEYYGRDGFVVAPFKENDQTYFMPWQENAFYQVPIQQQDLTFEKENKEASLSSLSGYSNLVGQAIEKINSNAFNKVVLSRKEIVESDKNLEEIFSNLLNAYPNAFVYTWYHPDTGLWLGATPETLLKVKGNRFKTMSLAGTQMWGDQVEWGKKEQEEQAIVTHYIAKKLNNFNVEIGVPFTKRAGSICHICTELTGTIYEQSEIKSLIQALHPTPAVCGEPLNMAKKFIEDYEGYNRHFYTGYLGWVSAQESELFVNLRCMHVEKFQSGQNAFQLYVGAGITNSSEPKKEALETIAKSNILKRVL